MAYGKCKQGKFLPKNRNKIIGDPYNLIYRSSWEKMTMMKLDDAKYVVKWGSECLVVPYVSPKDDRIHRYFPDFLVVTETPEGYRTTMIEVKPLAQTMPPQRKQGKKKERYINECITYSVNQAKWKAARALCKEKGWHFLVMTEREILGKK